MMERGPNDLEEIIQKQTGCIEKQRFVIEELKKRVTILTEELNANQLEICKLIKNND
jgi:hypothetical protein